MKNLFATVGYVFLMFAGSVFVGVGTMLKHPMIDQVITSFLVFIVASGISIFFLLEEIHDTLKSKL